MGKLDQLARDFSSLDKTLVRFLGFLGSLNPGAPFPADQHREVMDEATLRLETFQSVSADDNTLAARIALTARQAHALLKRFRNQADALDGGRTLRACVEGELIPLIDVLRDAERKASLSRVSTESAGHLTGAQIERWKLGNRIGRGGHAEVYRAENVVTGASMCMKVIMHAMASDERAEQRARFEREVRVPADVDHPFLVPVHDAAESREYDCYWFLMPEIRGRAIDVWGRGRAAIEIVRLYQRLLPAIADCHERGLVHRDLKPSNILIDDITDQPWILDFGLASMVGRTPYTQSGQFLGTMSYVSPEQADDARKATAQSDIWSLGVILYELLSGRPVFAQSTPTEVLSAVTRGEFKDPGEFIPPPLASVVRRCMRLRAHERFGDVVALSDALANALEEMGIAASSAATTRMLPTTFKGYFSPDMCQYCWAPDQRGARCANCGRILGVE